MKKLMIVEDDTNLQETYLNIFASLYDLVVADNGDDLVKQVENFMPDLILLDIILKGGVSGITVLQELKTNDKTKHIPVIVISNLANQQQNVKDAGGEEYLVKANLSMEELTQKVSQYLKSN